MIAAVVVGIDQLTKHWAVNRLSGGRDIDLIGSLRFHLTFNSGMAFSRGEGLGPIIGVVAVAVVAVLLVGLRREGSRLGDIASGMVIGGALGNVVDRLFRGDGWFHGSVIDFVDLQWWPIFNVADMGITIGGVLLVLSTLLAGRTEASTAAGAAGSTGSTGSDGSTTSTGSSGSADLGSSSSGPRP
ncbi:MAG: signal peptidase II [Acidimicrobiia bacterium]